MGEQAVRLVSEVKLSNLKLKIHQIEENLYIPLLKEPSPSVINEFTKSLSIFDITTHDFPRQTNRHFSHADFLVDKIPEKLLNKIPRSIDFIGDIAIIEIPALLVDYNEFIGEAILAANKSIRTVLAKSGKIEGVYRLRAFEFIAGIKKTDTVHREYGCIYHVDVAETYFSPRLSNEHNRVALLVEEKETVIDLFAGVGPFSIPIAKKQRKTLIYSIDINPKA